MRMIMTTFFFMFSLNSICQSNKVYCEYHVISLQYKTDTIKFDFPKVILVKEFGSTPLVYLGDEIILGKCFYIKEADSWKEIYKSASLQDKVIRGRPGELSNEHEWIRGSEGSEYGKEKSFDFSYMVILYIY